MVEKKQPRNFCTDCTPTEFRRLIRQAQMDEAASTRLLEDPRGFFGDGGYFLPDNAEVYLTRQEDYVGLLQDPNSRLYSEARMAAFRVHVTEGKGKCTYVDVT